jgi:hypothetical protein
MIDELNFINIVAECLGSNSRSVAAGSKTTNQIDLHHNYIRFILIIISDAPNSQLLVADSCSDFDQVSDTRMFSINRELPDMSD